MSDDDDEPGRRLREQNKPVPTGGLKRLWRTGRSAAQLAGTMLGRRDGDVNIAGVEQLAERLGELKGVGMKVGQILSFIDPSLPPEIRRALGVLQRSAPATANGVVGELLEQAFGARAETLLSTMERRPFSVASIGQVHRAQLDGRRVVVKVRHPGIEQAIAADFSAARGGLGLANTLLFGMATGAKDMVEETRATLLSECDFALEAAHQRAFRTWLAGEPGIVVPEVLDAWSSSAVLTTVEERGQTLEDFVANASSDERDAAGQALFRVMVGGFHELGLLYADPHPGNFAFRSGGQVVVYDFGCVRRFERRHTHAFSQMVLSLREGRTAALLRAARDFGFGIEGPEQEATFERFACSFFAPMLVRGPSRISPDGAVETSQMLRDKRALAKLRLPPQLVFLLRLRFGLYAVLATLGSTADWGALEAAWAARASER